MYTHANRIRGFTLTELMIAVAILGILAAFSAPSFKDFILSQNVKTAASDLHIALLRTRSESIKRNTSVTLKRAGPSWSYGWRIENPAAVGQYLDQHSSTKADISGPVSVTFDVSGRVTATSTVSFDISATGTAEVRCVQITLSGRPVVKKSAC